MQKEVCFSCFRYHKADRRLTVGQTTFAEIAQLVEHRSPKPRVVGSSPAFRANSGSSPDWLLRLGKGK